MIEIENFQVRGLPGVVNKVRFGDRKVDFWAPEIPSEHILVAFDGQNILDKRNIGINPHQRATWKLAQSAIRIAELKGLTPPTVICVYHTPYDFDPIGRLREYTPARFMNKKEDWLNESFGLYKGDVGDFVDRLTSEELLNLITEGIVPSITHRIGQSIVPAKTALLGASMGGLAAIYGVIQKPDFFHAALSFSPHWVIGGDALAEKMMSQFPAPGSHKLWMSRGTKGLDSKYEQSQKIADKRIRSRGYIDDQNLITKVLNRGAHSNATWARYVPGALDFWMKG
jgi:predicted alpha/beta superfamily hydrolase